MIPNIIHQTWKDEHPPRRFERSMLSWQAYHPQWEYRFWTDADLAGFVKRRYRHLWPLYQSYPDDIQRVDAARYMLLHHYGGLYSDLDLLCIHPLDAYRKYPVVLAPTSLSTFSNDLMMSVPGHPLFRMLVDSLPAASHRWQRPLVSRHFRILLTTGSLYLTMTVRRSAYRRKVIAFHDAHYHSHDAERAYVFHLRGDTWMGWDSFVFKAAERSWKRLFVAAAGAAALIGYLR
ncbi:MAG: glycosyltransferase [Pseudomonadota bacterium]